MKTPHPDGIDIDPVPHGFQETTGFILTVETGKVWLTLDGDETRDWTKRGVWPTAAKADRARARFCSTFWRGE